jgi:hypothetical protein
VNNFGQRFVADFYPSRQCLPPMNAIASRCFFGPLSVSTDGSQKARFREKFQRSLRACLRRGFSIEESFGMIWVETWEEIALSEEDQSALYEELICWAKTVVQPQQNRVFTPIIHKSYSQLNRAR